MTKDLRIALAVIAGSDAIEEGIGRMFKSVEHKVDGVYVAYTASENGLDDDVFDQIFDLMDPEIFRYGTVSPAGWHDDFARARQYSFDLVRRAIEREDTDYDFIFWMDCDDVLPAEVDLRAACQEMIEARAHVGFMQYQYHYDVDRDVLLSSHFKERLFRADVDWQWEYPIHENCRGPMGTRMMKLGESYTVRHLRGEVKPKRERNRRIVKDWFEREGEHEPRAVMYMAHETFALAEETESLDAMHLLGVALKLYQQFIASSPAGDDAYACNRQVAEILRTLGRYDDAINIDMQGVKMEPTWPQSYVGIAETHHAMEDWENALVWARMARNINKLPVTLHAVEHLAGEYKPFMIEGDCYMRLGRLEEAVAVFEDAVEIYDDEFTCVRCAEAIEAFRAAEREVGPATANRREEMWGSRPNKSVAFFVPPSIEDWNPSLLKEGGLGGTETCVIQLAENLAARGWRVAIFGSPGYWENVESRREEWGEGSIEWYRAGAFHPDEPFTVFVALRDPQILDAPIKAKKKILWLHDVSIGDSRYGEFGDRFSKVDCIVCPSVFHIEHIGRVYKGHMNPWTAENHVVLNAFDHRWFDHNIANTIHDRDPYRVVYASSPDRGLPRLLDLWPAIASAVPAASLHIYYGWDSIDAIIEKGLPTAPMLAHFKKVTEATIDRLVEAGHKIVWHGRVNQDVLGEDFKKSGILAYPANFMETFGLVFAQAMMAGMVPVVPKLGFLSDLVGDVGIVVPGSPDSMEFGDRFVKAVAHAAEPPIVVREQLQDRVQGLNWENTTDAWERVFGANVGASS